MNDYKVCSKCGEEKELNKDNFAFLNYHNLWAAQCRVCSRIAKRKYYNNNKEKCHAATKRWSERNPDKCKIHSKKSHKKYYNKNRGKILEKKREYNKRPEVKERHNKWCRDRRKNNPVYRVKTNVSRAVNDGLTRQLSSKRGRSVWEFLDYSPKELAEYLESKFEDWMTWNNHGVHRNDGIRRWNVDHIIPQSDLPYDSMEHPNFLKCWALSNLRPLEARKNIIEGSSRARHKNNQ
jgi:hypothetical protein